MTFPSGTFFQGTFLHSRNIGGTKGWYFCFDGLSLEFSQVSKLSKFNQDGARLTGLSLAQVYRCYSTYGFLEASQENFDI